MPRVAITPETTTRDGLAPSYAAADAVNGHQFDNASQGVIVHVINAGGSPTDVTFLTPGTVDGLAVADRTVTVAAGTDLFIGPFRNSQYGAGAAKTTVEFDITIDTSVSIACIIPGVA